MFPQLASVVISTALPITITSMAMSMNHGFYVTLITCCILTSFAPSALSEKSFRLSSGHSMPAVGLGTHGLNKEVLENVLSAALDNGLRYIDTGFIYQNEESIGKTLKKWFDRGGKREDIFITSKLPYFGNQPSAVEKYLKLSLEKLGLQYVDMYLIHAPFGVIRKNDSYDPATNEDGTVILDVETDHVAIWKEMEKQVKEGRTRSIGLSNFNETQITNILNHAEIKPSNLQIEVHLYHQQKPLRKFCKKHDILVTGYAPLGSTNARKHLRPDQKEKDFPSPVRLPEVVEIAKKHGKSSAQVLLRHSVQAGVAVIPGSKNPEHLKSNLEIFDFELTNEETKRLDALDKGENGKIFDYKFLKGIENHKEYPFVNLSS